MKKLFIIVVVIAMLTTMSTAGFAAENELADSQLTPDVQQTKYTLGDINENGEIDSMDYVLLKRAYFGTYALSDITAGDVNGNDEIDSMDYVLLKRAYFGTYELNEQSSSSEEEIIDPYSPTFENYEDYIKFTENTKLPAYFVSYDELSQFGEFSVFVCLSDATRQDYSSLFYVFVDEIGTELPMYVNYTPLSSFAESIKSFTNIDKENINHSDMRTATIVDSTARKYTHQGIEYVYSIHGEIMSIRWRCGDIEYVLSGLNGYPTTDKNTAANRLLNLETAPEVISNLKSYTRKTNN